MKALICDICGGKLKMGTGGVAVCESCGMEYTQERVKEMIQEIKGTVKVDNSHLIENYYSLAKNAYDSNNLSEAESYCNKIIEIDPNNFQSWWLKGKSAGWQSTLKNIRLSETAICFGKAVKNSPEDMLKDLIEDCKNTMSKISSAIINLRGENFTNWPSEDSANGFVSDLNNILTAVNDFISNTGVAIKIDDIMTPIVTSINNAVKDAWNNKIKPEYLNDNNGHPSDYVFKQMLDQADNCIYVLKNLDFLSDSDNDTDIVVYKNIIALNEFCATHSSYEQKLEDTGIFSPSWNWVWRESLSLTAEAKASRRKTNAEYNVKINNLIRKKEAKIAAEKAEKARLERERAEKRFKEYWESHQEEKVKLETEKIEKEKSKYKLQDELKVLENKANEENRVFDDEIMSLKQEKSNISVFKGKDRKLVQDKIDSVIIKKQESKKQFDLELDALNNQIKQIEDRINIIKTDLTKPR